MIAAAVHLTASALCCLLWRDVPPLIFLASLALSLAPDLDTPRSLVGRMLPPVSAWLDRQVGHRTATHSLPAVILIAGLTALVAFPWWPLLTLAYASHLIVDLLIGHTGIVLFWPLPHRVTLAAWRDDGPAPKFLLYTLVAMCIAVVSWPNVAPLVAAPSERVAQAVQAPTATATPTGTPAPSIALSFVLPSDVNLSSLEVAVGARIEEGQILARWSQPTPSRWSTPTLPPHMPSPAVPPLPAAVEPLHTSDQAALISANAAVEALQLAYPAERESLVAEQQREVAEMQRRHAEAQRAIEELQPIHEREQTEHQHAVDAAHTDLLDVQAAAALIDSADPMAVQRATERVHEAERELQLVLDAQDRMRTNQGLKRQRANQALKDAAADLKALPALHQAALAKLDADHSAAVVLAQGRQSAAANAQAAEERRRSTEQLRASATAAALRSDTLATATVEAQVWREVATATMEAHHVAVTATAQALPTPQPDHVVSRAAGEVVAITASEQDGRLVVTIEVVP